MNLEIIVSTSFSRLDQAIDMAKEALEINSNLKFLVVCQLFDRTDGTSLDESEYQQQQIRVLFSHTKGLAVSRNIGLNNATEDYVWILDDDVIIKPEALLKVISGFEQYNVDFITTQYEFGHGKFSKKYSDTPNHHSKLSIMKVSSIEIFLNRKSFISRGLCFDERFGLGSIYLSGEENIILVDALGKGLNGMYLPFSTSIHPEITSGHKFETRKAVASKGALIKRIFGWRGLPFVAAFYVKKLISGHFKSVGSFVALSVIFKGYFKFRK